MAPIWVIVVTTALVIIFTMRQVGVWGLARTAEREPNACNRAAIFYTGAHQRLQSIRNEAARRRLEAGDFDQPSLGSLAGNDDVEKAQELLRQALQICPQHSPSQRLLGLLAWYSGEEATAYLHMGEHYRLEGQFQQAEAAYAIAVESNPDDPQTILGMARSLQLRNANEDLARFVADHREALTQSPQGLLFLGRWESVRGNAGEARRLLEDGFRMAPEDRESLLAYHAAIRQVGALREGADFLMQAGDESGVTIPETYHTAAIIYIGLKDDDSAAKALRRALALHPNNAGLRFELSLALYRLGRRDEARDEVRRAMADDFNFVMRAINERGVDPR